jgi:hypothetical protein
MIYQTLIYHYYKTEVSAYNAPAFLNIDVKMINPPNSNIFNVNDILEHSGKIVSLHPEYMEILYSNIDASKCETFVIRYLEKSISV